jgi:thioredoxin-related protein
MTFNRSLLSLLLFLAPYSQSFGAAAVAEPSFDEVLAKATAEHKRVLIDFSGSDWCYWCQVMEKDVLSKAEFKAYADKNLVVLVADFPSRTQLSREVQERNYFLKNKYRVNGFPTFVVLSADGKELDRVVGYVRGGPQAFIEILRKSENLPAPDAGNPPAAEEK